MSFLRGPALGRLLRQPAVHFLVTGGLLYAGVSTWSSGAAETSAPLHIAAGQVARLKQDLLFELGRPASPGELRTAVDRMIDEEILVRHALALGLDREPTVERRLAQLAAFIDGPDAASADRARELRLHTSDRVVRNILVDRAGRLVRAAVLSREPDEASLARYLEEHAEEFRSPERFALVHVEVSSGRPAAIDALIPRLQDEDPSASAVADGHWGDPPSVPGVLPPLSERDVARRFGEEFARQLTDRPVEEWFGPVLSRHGVHAVKILDRLGGEIPSLAAVRDRVRARWRHDYAERWLHLRLAQLREGYQIQVAGAAWSGSTEVAETQKLAGGDVSS